MSDRNCRTLIVHINDKGQFNKIYKAIPKENMKKTNHKLNNSMIKKKSHQNKSIQRAFGYGCYNWHIVLVVVSSICYNPIFLKVNCNQVCLLVLFSLPRLSMYVNTRLPHVTVAFEINVLKCFFYNTWLSVALIWTMC